MTNNSHVTKSGVSMPFIDLWSIVYLLMVYSFTLIFEQANIVVFAIYFVFALPFVNYLDKFACICFVISTMSYFFLGGSEGVWSLYTILAAIIVLHTFARATITLPMKAFLYLIWMAAAVVLSYTHSRFGYSMGMFAMIYNIAVAALLAITVKINKQALMSFLPMIAAFQLVAYVGFLLIKGHFDGYGFSISEKVNHNTFGASVAILSIIIFVKIVFFKSRSLTYRLIWILSFILTIVSGSRNALMAMVLTSVIIYMISQKHQKKTISGGIKFLIAVCVIVSLGGLILPEIGIDLERYNYVELVNSGGSNRTAIWETLTPVIWRDYRWFGYGPSHYCSEQMINSLMDVEYSHTHNTIFEAWGELGIFGLIPFLLILLLSFRKSHFHIKNETCYLMIGFLFINFLLLSLGESFFAKIELWIVIGLLLSNKMMLDESNINKTV